MFRTLARSCACLAASVLALAAPAAALPVAASQPAQAKVTLVEPITVIKKEDLDFGYIMVSGAGTAVMNPTSNSLSTTGGVSAAGGLPTSASFVGASRGWNLVWIRLPNQPITLTRSGGSETMTVGNWTLQGSNLRLITPSTTIEFRVGATLNVGANQADGFYSGTFDINVEYY